MHIKWKFGNRLRISQLGGVDVMSINIGSISPFFCGQKCIYFRTN